MDVKDLNKPQLLLLAILLSFVTSIATGITTVTLIQQAPPSVTVPINRVVRQTVEKIVPGKDTVETVVIKEEDLVVDAIAKNESAIFSVTKQTQDADGNNIEVTAGKGFVVSDEGVVATDGSLVSDSKGVYFLQNESGKFNAEFMSLDKNGVAFLKIGTPVNGTDKISYTMPTMGDLSKIKIGQKILVLDDSISSFIFNGNKNMKVSVTKSNGGSMVIDLDGEVLGMALSGDTSSFVSIDSILSSITPKEPVTPATPEPTTTP
jgi:hypothetical protein